MLRKHQGTSPCTSVYLRVPPRTYIHSTAMYPSTHVLGHTYMHPEKLQRVVILSRIRTKSFQACRRFYLILAVQLSCMYVHTWVRQCTGELHLPIFSTACVGKPGHSRPMYRARTREGCFVGLTAPTAPSARIAATSTCGPSLCTLHLCARAPSRRDDFPAMPSGRLDGRFRSSVTWTERAEKVRAMGEKLGQLSSV
jgi:hypothetical protein